MDSLFEAVLFYDDLSEERRADIRETLADHPELQATLSQWMAVRAAVRRDLEADLPERDLLVLYALDEAGMAHVLSADERTALQAARSRIEDARAAHPALDDIVERIQEEQRVFHATWTEHVEPAMETNGVRPERDAKARRSHRTADRSWALRLAAGVAMILLAIGIVFMLPDAPSTTTVDTDNGEVRTVNLADGSTARLVGVTRFTYPDEVPEDDAYTVTVHTGKAFFEVPTTGDEQTFVVETPTAQAEVLGTQFGVDTAPHHTDITLAEGALRVGTPGFDDLFETLEPGTSSRVERDQPPTPPERVELNDALAWTGLFIFRQTPMEQIATQLEQAYEVTIDVDDTLTDATVTGTFERDQDVNEVLNAIAATLGVTVDQHDTDHYRIVDDA